MIVNRKRKGGKLLSATGVIAGLLFLTQPANAQNTPSENRISLDAAYAQAIQNNLQLKGSSIQLEQSRVMLNTGYEVPKTGLFVENEDLTPTDSKGILKIGVSQSMDWPGLYKARKNLLQQQVKSVELAQKIKVMEVKREVQTVYYRLWYFQNKHQLWKRLDSLYSTFAKAAALRVKVGESAGLDSISANAKARETKLQVQLIDRDIFSEQIKLKMLLATDILYLPENKLLQQISLSLPKTDFNNHPEIQMQQQQVAIADAGINLSKQKSMPSFEGRFFSQRLYGLNNPFSGFSVTMGFPIFGRSTYRNTVKAAELEKNYQQSITDYNVISITSAYGQAYQQLQKNNDLISYYQSTGLKQAEAIIKAANLAYRSGEIGFGDLNQFLTQAIDIQRNYLDVLNEYNQSAIQLNYFIQSK
jgi:cobalt-zinc-cadmium resistance protein CzcA